MDYQDLLDLARQSGPVLDEHGEFHLKTAYCRTGVHRQSDLVRLIIAALRNRRQREKP